MKKPRPPSNQELRTRKDLLLAAGRLLKQGRKPTMDEVAEGALVSRATAYRYFPSVDALLVEVPIEEAVVGPEDLLRDADDDDPETRIDRAEAALHRIVYDNEAQLRVMLAHAIARPAGAEAAPTRQNRRVPLIESALAPARQRFRAEAYEKLCGALALIFGPEAMIVFRDVLRVDEQTAREIKSWAARALVRAALEESKARQKR